MKLWSWPKNAYQSIYCDEYKLFPAWSLSKSHATREQSWKCRLKNAINDLKWYIEPWCNVRPPLLSSSTTSMLARLSWLVLCQDDATSSQWESLYRSTHSLCNAKTHTSTFYYALLAMRKVYMIHVQNELIWYQEPISGFGLLMIHVPSKVIQWWGEMEEGFNGIWRLFCV